MAGSKAAAEARQHRCQFLSMSLSRIIAYRLASRKPPFFSVHRRPRLGWQYPAAAIAACAYGASQMVFAFTT